MDNAVARPDSPQPANKAPSSGTQSGTWIVASVALGLFLLLTVIVYLDVPGDHPYFAWDLAVSRTVQSASHPGFDALMRTVSLAGDNAVWASVLVVVACLVLLALRAWREAAVLLGVVLAGQAVKIGTKLLVGRPRPDPDLVNVLIEAQEIHSFPSGHTVHYVVFFGFLGFLSFTLVKLPVLRWLLLFVFVGLVLLVGLARIYLGAHWVSDIVGGYLLGGAILAAGIGLYRRWSASAK